MQWLENLHKFAASAKARKTADLTFFDPVKLTHFTP